MLLSILIATLERRRDRFAELRAELAAQIGAAGAEGAVELVWARDDGAAAVGAKRNLLMAAARGDYVCFVDDDDTVHPRYVELVVAALRAEPAVDVVGIRGVMTFRGRRPRSFEYSVRYRDYSATDAVLRRPPHHLNPIRRTVAARYPFLAVDRHEDHDWALRLAADGTLVSERMIAAPLYRYRSRRLYGYQWLLDFTERPRHRLGLRTVNLVRRRAGACRTPATPVAIHRWPDPQPSGGQRDYDPAGAALGDRPGD